MPDSPGHIRRYGPVVRHDLLTTSSRSWLSGLLPLIPNQSLRLDVPCMACKSFDHQAFSLFLEASVLDSWITAPVRQDADRSRTSRRPALDDVRISRRVGVCGRVRVRVLSLSTTHSLLSTHAEAHSSLFSPLFSFSFSPPSIFCRGSTSIISCFHSLSVLPIRSLNNLGP
jgi:hypothetical protein